MHKKSYFSAFKNKYKKNKQMTYIITLLRAHIRKVKLKKKKKKNIFY